MPRLSNFFQTEMARPVGSLAKTMVAALEKARQSGEEFTVKQFCDWLAEVGVENPHPASVGIRLSKLIAPEGSRPDALHPIAVARAGRRGPGGTATYRYIYDGPPGRPPKEPGQAKPEPTADFDEIPDDGGGETAPEPVAPSKAKMPPNLLPKPSHGEGSSFAEETMADLAEVGFGEDNGIWPQIAQAQNDVAVQKIMNQEGVPPMVRTKIIRVAKHIFNRMGKDWETGGVAAPEPAATGAGDRKYAKGWQGKPKASAPEPEPEAMPADDDDEGEFLEPDDEFDPTTAAQAGAANFVRPSAPPPPSVATAPAKPSMSTKNLANLMKRFKK